MSQKSTINVIPTINIIKTYHKGNNLLTINVIKFLKNISLVRCAVNTRREISYLRVLSSISINVIIWLTINVINLSHKIM